MNFILIAFVTGVTGFHLLPLLPDHRWLVAAIAIPICWRYARLRPAAALLAGFYWSFLNASIQLSAMLPLSHEGRDLTLTGVISSIPSQKGSITRFEMDVSTIQSMQGEIAGPEKVRLSWYKPEQTPVPGEFWQLKVRLKRPRGWQNPGGFDYARWLFSHGIQATGYVRHWDGNQPLGDGYQAGWLDRQRMHIGTEINQRFEDARTAALIRALAIGDRGGMSAEDWEAFTRTGTNHLVAISGLHIGIVAGLMFFLGQWLWRRSEWLMLRLAAVRAGAWVALLSATVYAALAGFSLPTQRALIMLCLGLGAVLIGRSLSLSRSLSLALFAVVLLDPWAPLSAGFWLSFGAVAVILFSLSGRIRRPVGWRQWGRVQWVVALGLAPLLFILFNQASLISPLVNLILVPWFSLVLVPLVLLSVSVMTLPVGFLLGLTGGLTKFTLHGLDWASQLPYVLVYRPDLPAWVWATAIAGVFFILLPRGMPGRPLGLLLIAPMLLNQPTRLQEGSLLFTLLDVGQGLSCVVETAGHVLVFDTGPAFSSGFNTAEAVLIPYLHSHGIRRIDQLIVSNGDWDHAGGVEALLRGMEVDRIMSGEALDFMDVERCRSGQTWEWDGVSFRILHPHESDNFSGSNNASCVLKIESAGGSLLITGDVERKAEVKLVERHAESLRADILIAPHHGSNTSSSDEFVQRVKPAYVLFPTGYRNRFGFPKQPVIERWQAAGAILLNTAETGAIQFQILANQELSNPMLYRRDHQHYWSMPFKIE